MIVIRTKIYEVRQSSKGWSGIHSLYFDKENALTAAARLQEAAKEKGYKANFRVYEHTAGDTLCYHTEDK